MFTKGYIIICTTTTKFTIQKQGHNLLTQAKIISDPQTNHLPRHQILPQNLTLPPELINTIKEIFINKNTLPIFHPGTYQVNTLGIIGICIFIIFAIGLITGIKLCCCPQADICKMCHNWCKDKENPTSTQQEMKTMKRRPKEYKAIKYSAQNQMTSLQPDFDHTQ